MLIVKLKYKYGKVYLNTHYLKVNEMAQYPNLGSLQAQVLCYVAEENPKSMNKTAMDVASRNMYKNIRDIFIKLENDGYLKNDDEKGWYPTYIGVNLALLNEANPSKVRQKVGLFFTDRQLEMLLLACDVAEHPNLGIEILKIFSLSANSIAQTGKALLSMPLNITFIDDFLPLMKKYPGLYNHTHGVLKKALDYYLEA